MAFGEWCAEALEDPNQDFLTRGHRRSGLVVAPPLDVLGFQRLEYELTPDAIDLGLDAALPPVLGLNRQIGGFGRGERDSPSLTQQSVKFLLINRTPPRGAAERSA